MLSTVSVSSGDAATLDRFAKVLRKCGKRTVADKILLDAAKVLLVNGYRDPLTSRIRAVRRVQPRVEVRSQTRAGQRVQIPVARTPERQEGRGLRRLKEAAETRKRQLKRVSFAECLAIELRAVLGSSSGSRGVGGSKGGAGTTSLALARREVRHRTAISQRGALNF